jgi:pyruvate dehydrogenase E2 component (dihydrolipoamide acetyltransferase)
VPETKKVLVPDIGDFKDVPVIEVLVKAGDSIKAEDPLIVLESDKATIEVPSPFAGVIREISVKVGDKVSQSTLLLAMEVSEAETAPETSQPEPFVGSASEATSAIPPAPSASVLTPTPIANGAAQPISRPGAVGETASVPTPAPPLPSSRPGATPAAAGVSLDEAAFAQAHASPSMRRFARELGVNLGMVKGTGPKQRILREDLLAYVKTQLSAVHTRSGTELDLLPWPRVDFAKFGPVESKPLSRIQKLSGANLHRNWVMIPHVTQFDEADITELESLRKESNESVQKGGVKVTILAFLMRASIAALKKFPEFNASLDRESEEMNLVMKKYYHLGFAVDTPSGLMVPVIRDVDQKGVLAIGHEMAALAAQAREGKLKATDMQGASFTISSLGGIGGTAFTPIINAPEVAILGISRASMRPVYHDGRFVPRLMLPLSLSYDHRVIDGATAARFTSMLGEVLADMRRVLL